MKKSIIILSLLAVCAMAGAQTTYRYVYVPGVGERQFGFSIAPTFSAQHLKAYAEGGVNPANHNKPFSYNVDGTVNNTMGFSAGIFYGYETTHGRAVEWGNYSSLYYGMNPFHGKVEITRNGIPEEHKINYFSHYLKLHVNPFLTFPINDQFSVSAGLGMNFAPQLTGKLKLDGNVIDMGEKEPGEWILLSLLCVNFDANISMKYWLTDEWFVGIRAQYSFFNLFNVLYKEENGDDAENLNEVLKEYNGSIKINMDNGTGSYSALPRNYLQTVFSIGYTW